jgi:F0F1-type ATP synthase membrane subunit b/b'
MDIQHLVDRLEDLIDEGRHVPFSKFTLIDEERALEIIDQMRISVPEQIEKASRLINQRDRVLAQAREEAERMTSVAQSESERLTTRDAIVQTAQNRATNIIEQARKEAEGIRADADDYVLQVLNELENQLINNLTVVRNGMSTILEQRAASQARMQAIYDQAEADLAAITEDITTAAPDTAHTPTDPTTSDEVTVDATADTPSSGGTDAG